MPRKTWKARQYKTAADALRKLGYDISYKANDRKTFHQRGIIRRLYEDKKSYINYTDFARSSKTRQVRGVEYNFKFQKLTARERGIAKRSGLFSAEQFTKGGVFIEKPANVTSSQYKVKFIPPDGVELPEHVEISGGIRRDKIVRLDPEILAVDPKEAVESAIGSMQPEGVSLIVNGFSSSHMSASIKQFYRYLEDELLPQWMKRNGDKYDEEGEALGMFTDIFSLRLLF